MVPKFTVPNDEGYVPEKIIWSDFFIMASDEPLGIVALKSDPEGLGVSKDTRVELS